MAPSAIVSAVPRQLPLTFSNFLGHIGELCCFIDLFISDPIPQCIALSIALWVTFLPVYSFQKEISWLARYWASMCSVNVDFNNSKSLKRSWSWRRQEVSTYSSYFPSNIKSWSSLLSNLSDTGFLLCWICFTRSQ